MKTRFDFHLNHEEKEKRKKALDDVSSLSQLNIEDLQSRQWIAVYDRRGYTTTLNIGMIGNTLYIVSHDSGEYEVVEKVNTLRDLKYGLSDVPRDYTVIEPGNEPIAESDFEGYDEATIEGEDEDLFAEDSIKEGAKEGLLKMELKKLKENAHNRVLYSGYTLIDAALDGDSIVLVFYKNSVTTEEPLNLVKNLNKKLNYLAVEKYRVTRDGVNVILGVQGDFEENPDFRDNTPPMSREERLRARGLSEEQIQDYLKKLNEPFISSKQEPKPFVPDTRTKEEKLRARGWSEEKIQEYLEAVRELKAHDSKANVPKKFDFQLSYEEKIERKKALDSVKVYYDKEAVSKLKPEDNELMKFSQKLTAKRIIITIEPTRVAIDSEKDYDSKFITAIERWAKAIKKHLTPASKEGLGYMLDDDWYSGMEWFDGLTIEMDLEDWEESYARDSN